MPQNGSGYDQTNQQIDYTQNYGQTAQTGYNANGYTQTYPAQNYAQPTEYDQSQQYTQDYR